MSTEHTIYDFQDSVETRWLRDELVDTLGSSMSDEVDTDRTLDRDDIKNLLIAYEKKIYLQVKAETESKKTEPQPAEAIDNRVQLAGVAVAKKKNVKKKAEPKKNKLADKKNGAKKK